MMPATILDFIQSCDNKQVIGIAHKLDALFNRPVIDYFKNKKGDCIIQTTLNEVYSVPSFKEYTISTKRKVNTCFRQMVAFLVSRKEITYGFGQHIKKTYLSNVCFEALGNNNEFIKAYPDKEYLIYGFESENDEFSINEVPEEIINDLLKDYDDRDNEYEFIYTPNTNNLLDQSNEVLIKKMEKLTFEVLAIQNALKIRAVK